MRYAILNNERAEATKTGQRALCPCCNSEVISNCGDIKVNYWSHKNKDNCDRWYEPMTEWHKSWQNLFPEKCREVQHKDLKTGERHIADVKIGNTIFEFQHSSIGMEEVKKRTEFYTRENNLVWVFDFTERESMFEFKKYYPHRVFEKINLYTYKLPKQSKKIEYLVSNENVTLIIEDQNRDTYLITDHYAVKVSKKEIRRANLLIKKLQAYYYYNTFFKERNILKKENDNLKNKNDKLTDERSDHVSEITRLRNGEKETELKNFNKHLINENEKLKEERKIIQNENEKILSMIKKVEMDSEEVSEYDILKQEHIATLEHCEELKNENNEAERYMLYAENLIKKSKKIKRRNLKLKKEIEDLKFEIYKLQLSNKKDI